jgi:Putative Flp pilus-assembly TadE/G-like
MTRNRISHRDPGQVLVFFALAVLGLLALLALVVDGGYLYVQRRTAQTAADAAALAGAAELSRAPSQSLHGNSTIGPAVCTYAQSNVFGVTPNVMHAYFVDTNEAQIPGAEIALPAACGGTDGATTDIPSTANGVHVDVNIPFHTFLAGMFGVVNVTAAGSATGNIGIATAGDVRNAPFIICGGGDGRARRIVSIPVQVATTTPQFFGPTPAVLPTTDSNGPPTTPEILLATPATGSTQPAFFADPAMDGHVYYIKGQHLDNGGGDCGVSGFKGGADPTQAPTINWVNIGSGTPVAMVDLQGNKVPQINGNAAAANACAAGTDPSTWYPGEPGCVMWLPIANGGAKPLLNVQAWGAFYVWCGNISGGQCQEFAGQFLADWKAGGPSVDAWQAGTGGASVVVHLGQ